jgi:hypothetical protein
MQTENPTQPSDLVLDYRERAQFFGFHARGERFACAVTHRRAGKTVACIHELQHAAIACARVRPRFAYLSPFLKQSKTVAWDYLRSAIAPLIDMGARVHESELRADYPGGGQVRLYGADNPDALRGIYLDGVVLDEYADMDARVWAEIIRPALADRAGWAVFIGTPRGRNAFFALWRRAIGGELVFPHAQGERHCPHSGKRACARPARPVRGAVRAGIRMLLRGGGRGRLLRPVDGARRGGAARGGSAA